MVMKCQFLKYNVCYKKDAVVRLVRKRGFSAQHFLRVIT